MRSGNHNEFVAISDLCLILHGCPSDENSVILKNQKWMNWVEEECIKQGINAIAPDMPTPWKPDYGEWKRVIESFPITNKSILVGHSCGGAFLVRWLLETRRKVQKLILVAPAKIPERPGDPRGVLYEFELPKLPVAIADDIVMFTSNDSPHHLASFELYKTSLHPRIINVPEKGHFLFTTMKTRELPEVLEEIVR